MLFFKEYITGSAPSESCGTTRKSRLEMLIPSFVREINGAFTNPNIMQGRNVGVMYSADDFAFTCSLQIE